MYKVVFTKSANKSFRKLPKNTAKLVREKLNQISSDPYVKHNNVTRLQNRPGYRLRIGNWRVIYEIQNDRLIILVLKIASRGGVYR